MQSGELIVIGKDKAVIHLHNCPSRVVVLFKDECVIAPCNPHHHDSLEWEVFHPHSHHHPSTLVIKWHVSGVREINWRVYY